MISSVPEEYTSYWTVSAEIFFCSNVTCGKLIEHMDHIDRVSL